jgi:hypothetical protein
MNTIPKAIPNEATIPLHRDYIHSSRVAPMSQPTLNIQLLPSAARRPANNDALLRASLQAFRLGQPILHRVLRQEDIDMLRKAIVKEKTLIVRSIIRLQQHAAQLSNDSRTARTLDLCQRDLNATRVVDKIGSQIRISEPYIDATTLPGIEHAEAVAPRTNRGGHTETFPEVSQSFACPSFSDSLLTLPSTFQKLHRMLKDVQDTPDASIVSFLPHGRAFIVHDVERFVNKILPKYVNHGVWHSFTRQLSLYGFRRVKKGPDCGAYYHEIFLRGHNGLCLHMRRVGVPQKQRDRRLLTKIKQIGQTPNFYALKALPS